MPTMQGNGRTNQYQLQASPVQEEWRNPRRTSGIKDPQISVEDAYKMREW
jgi:hypothetical protein